MLDNGQVGVDPVLGARQISISNRGNGFTVFAHAKALSAQLMLALVDLAVAVSGEARAVLLPREVVEANRGELLGQLHLSLAFPIVLVVQIRGLDGQVRSLLH